MTLCSNIYVALRFQIFLIISICHCSPLLNRSRDELNTIDARNVHSYNNEKPGKSLIANTTTKLGNVVTQDNISNNLVKEKTNYNQLVKNKTIHKHVKLHVVSPKHKHTSNSPSKAITRALDKKLAKHNIRSGAHKHKRRRDPKRATYFVRKGDARNKSKHTDVTDNDDQYVWPGEETENTREDIMDNNTEDADNYCTDDVGDNDEKKANNTNDDVVDADIQDSDNYCTDNIEIGDDDCIPYWGVDNAQHMPLEEDVDDVGEDVVKNDIGDVESNGPDNINSDIVNLEVDEGDMNTDNYSSLQPTQNPAKPIRCSTEKPLPALDPSFLPKEIENEPATEPEKDEDHDYEQESKDNQNDLTTENIEDYDNDQGPEDNQNDLTTENIEDYDNDQGPGENVDGDDNDEDYKMPLDEVFQSPEQHPNYIPPSRNYTPQYYIDDEK